MLVYCTVQNKACVIFQMFDTVWISKNFKIKIYRRNILSIFYYGTEARKIKKSIHHNCRYLGRIYEPEE